MAPRVTVVCRVTLVTRVTLETQVRAETRVPVELVVLAVPGAPAETPVILISQIMDSQATTVEAPEVPEE